MRVAYVYAATNYTNAVARPPACGSRPYSLAEHLTSSVRCCAFFSQCTHSLLLPLLLQDGLDEQLALLRARHISRRTDKKEKNGGRDARPVEAQRVEKRWRVRARYVGVAGRRRFSLRPHALVASGLTH